MNTRKKRTKIKIIPAILEKEFLKIEKRIKEVQEYVDLVQLDICDGNLTPVKTFASSGSIKSFSKLVDLYNKINIENKVDFEIDLIVNMENKSKKKSDKFLNSILLLKPKKIIFHFSGVGDWDEIFSFFKDNKIKTKIALGVWLSDDLKKINKILKKYPFKYIQIMGIEKVGYGGQKLSEKVFKKIKYFVKKYPKFPIQIDGGVKIDNAKKLKEAGVSLFVSGSGIYKSNNIKERIKDFKKI